MPHHFVVFPSIWTGVQNDQKYPKLATAILILSISIRKCSVWWGSLGRNGSFVLWEVISTWRLPLLWDFEIPAFSPLWEVISSCLSHKPHAIRPLHYNPHFIWSLVAIFVTGTLRKKSNRCLQFSLKLLHPNKVESRKRTRLGGNGKQPFLSF